MSNYACVLIIIMNVFISGLPGPLEVYKATGSRKMTDQYNQQLITIKLTTNFRSVVIYSLYIIIIKMRFIHVKCENVYS